MSALRHSGEGRNPGPRAPMFVVAWTPAFAGVTREGRARHALATQP